MKSGRKMRKNNSFLQFIKFGIIGGINSVLQTLIYMCFVTLGCNHLLSNAIGWVITVLNSYLLNSLFVFQKGKGEKRFSLRALCKVFASYATTGLILNSLLLILWIDILKIPAAVAQIPFVQTMQLPFQLPDLVPPVLNICISTPINFILNKFWAYRNRDNQQN